MTLVCDVMVLVTVLVTLAANPRAMGGAVCGRVVSCTGAPIHLQAAAIWAGLSAGAKQAGWRVTARLPTVGAGMVVSVAMLTVEAVLVVRDTLPFVVTTMVEADPFPQVVVVTGSPRMVEVETVWTVFITVIVIRSPRAVSLRSYRVMPRVSSYVRPPTVIWGPFYVKVYWRQNAAAAPRSCAHAQGRSASGPAVAPQTVARTARRTDGDSMIKSILTRVRNGRVVRDWKINESDEQKG